jgi:phosphohistidine phosphatase
MELILWRHAEAEAGVPDAGRKLTPKGRRQAKAVAKWLEGRLPKNVRVISSPARRCLQTAEELSKKVEKAAAADVGASATDLLRAAGWPDARGAVVVVGHQPALGRVVALLLCGEEADWSVKKGAAWWFSGRVRRDGTQAVLRAVIGPDVV